MKTTSSWIQDYSRSHITLESVEKTFNKIGLPIEKTENLKKTISNLIIGRVLKKSYHPSVKYLNIYIIDIGNTYIQIISKYGQASVNDKILVEVNNIGKISGIYNEGKLCSNKRLKINNTDENIVILPGSAPVGKDITQYIKLDDVIFDLEVTPNRGDALSTHGLTRDMLACHSHIKFKKVNIKPIMGEQLKSPSIKIHSNVYNKKYCSYFLGRVIRNVQNSESPLWLQKRLISVKIRPISTIVDIINYISYDMGQPMHVFDLDKIGDEITIRLSKKGELIEALDNKRYNLGPDMIVISDSIGIQSIPGVIGSEKSKCTLNTQNIFLESAFFNNSQISKTGRTLKINTDSRYRFERNVDQKMILPAMEKASAMIRNMCSGSIGKITKKTYKESVCQTILFNPRDIQTIGGMMLDHKESINILTLLGFHVEKNNYNGYWYITSPSWRSDIKNSTDLIEEVLRIKGYSSISTKSIPNLDQDNRFKEISEQVIYKKSLWEIRKLLISNNVSEVITSSFLSDHHNNLFGDRNIKIKNSINKKLSSLRVSLIPGLLLTIKNNMSLGQKGGSVFEIGNVFSTYDKDYQKPVLSVARFGIQKIKTWYSKEEKPNLFTAKEDVIRILSLLKIDGFKISRKNIPLWYHPGKSGEIISKEGKLLAIFGELNPNFAGNFDLNTNATLIEMFFSNFSNLDINNEKEVIEMSPYPTVKRDFSFIVDRLTETQDIISIIKKSNEELIKEVFLFDIYQGKNIESNKKSLSLSVNIKSINKTLTEAEINNICENIIQNVSKNANGYLRGY